MTRLRHLWLAFCVLMDASGVARAADCPQIVAEFNRAVDAGSEAEAQKFIDQISMDAQCGRFQIQAQRRLAAFRLAAVQYLMAPTRPPHLRAMFATSAPSDWHECWVYRGAGVLDFGWLLPYCLMMTPEL